MIRKLGNRSSVGFTLIELMVVVVIIGILAALAIPRFMTSAAKSKQSEAQQLLKQIYSMQRSYFMLHESYCLNGVTASSAAPQAYAYINVEILLPARYTYSMAASQNTFTCTATANIDDDATIDTWTINDAGQLINTINDATS
ncbi:MAG: prepilin-type N-terminal cleavage/methylation domain-containing protein [Candidatus Zixiibacteriota bacterium]|nr:MAG: prepilin-type N-terminal cleavage/methylation domain-containing protein [candidate division Zixibacteria bacterium]